MFIANAYAQSAGAASAESSFVSFLPLIVMFAVLWFLMIRPQMKKQKEQKAMMDGLKKSDEVITIGGLVGKITKVSDAYVTIEIAENTEVVVQKNAVTMLLPKDSIKSIS